MGVSSLPVDGCQEDLRHEVIRYPPGFGKAINLHTDLLLQGGKLTGAANGTLQFLRNTRAIRTASTSPGGPSTPCSGQAIDH